MDLIQASTVFKDGAHTVQSVKDVTTQAVAVSDSSNGTVLINMGGVVVSHDDSQYVRATTTCDVRKDDVVYVTMTGVVGGGATCVVTGVAGGGDRTKTAVTQAKTDAADAQQSAQSAQTKASQAQEKADQASQDANKAREQAQQAKQMAQEVKDVAKKAQDIAQATQQHFWSDEGGVHVSSESQTPDGEVNTLWNSLGLLIRKRLNNLLALTSSGLSIYDGAGNDADNIVAQFSKDTIRLGKARRRGRQLISSVISLLDGAGKIEYIDNPKLNKESLTISSQSAIELTSQAETHVSAGSTSIYGEGSLLLGTQSNTIKLQNDQCTMDIDPTVSLTAQHGISFTVPSAEQFTYNGEGVATIPKKLFSGTYANTKSAAIKLADVAANYSRLDVVYQTSGGDVGTATLYSPRAGMKFSIVAMEPSNNMVFIKNKAYEIQSDGKTINAARPNDSNSSWWAKEHKFPTTDNAGIYTSTVNVIGIIAVYGYKF
ncbi:hypothetical protein [Atopobium fossor]|uniref:hypothetical protein n=1 Tax=Atopobium fossor TaxID=39487 RepID=UPI0004230499|nr:hypothetical protein [Atopobium fossor]